MLGPPVPGDDRDADRRVGPATLAGTDPRRRPIGIAIVLAVVTTLVIAFIVALTRPPGESPGVARGTAAPDIVGTTLDGAPFSLADLRGRPVILNFWGPSCVPCREEFPLFTAKLAEHEADQLAIVGILTFDPPAPARDFIDELGASWPTIEDPDGALRTAYRVVARPQSYFIDRAGIVREIQVGELTAAEFERLYASISGPP